MADFKPRLALSPQSSIIPPMGLLAGIDRDIGMGASVSQIHSKCRGASAQDPSQDSSSDGNIAPVSQRPPSPLDYVMSNPINDIPEAFMTKVTLLPPSKHSSELNGFQDEDPEELAPFTKSRLEALLEDELAKHCCSEDVSQMKEGFKLLSDPKSDVDPSYIICYFFPLHLQDAVAQGYKDYHNIQPEGFKVQAHGTSGSPPPADPTQNSTKG